jgi:hypothetical protein
LGPLHLARESLCNSRIRDRRLSVSHAELRNLVRDAGRSGLEPDLVTLVLWAMMHGSVMLMRRLRPRRQKDAWSGASRPRRLRR